MNSSRVIIFSRHLNLKCSQQQNQYFLHEYTAEEKKIMQKEADGYYNNGPNFFSNKAEKSRLPKKTIPNNKLMLKNELDSEKKALHFYATAREKTKRDDDISKQVTDNLVFSDNSNSPNTYEPHCVLKLSFETNVIDKMESVRRFNIQLHYQVRKNGMMMGLNTETGKLEELTPEKALEMQNAIKAIETKLSNDNEFKAFKEQIASEQLSLAGKQIETLLQAKYSPISFACSTRILTVANQNSILPPELFADSEFDEATGKTIHKKRPDPSQIKTEEAYYINKHCVYNEQTDFILGTNTDDVIIRAELIARNNKFLIQSKDINRDEKTNLTYRLRNSNLLPDETSSNCCPLLDWLIELMNCIGKLIDNVICAMFAEEKPRVRFEL